MQVCIIQPRGSSNINNNGGFLFNFIMANDLDIMNKSNRPTFVTSNGHKVTDIIIAIIYVGNFVKNWHVPEEVSCSDHRHIQFNITGFKNVLEFYCNLSRTDWESYRTDRAFHLHGT
jgi:hypothetical protein